MKKKYHELSEKSLKEGTISSNDINWILSSEEVDLLLLLHAVFQVRYTYFKNRVKIHILNNVQSGGCTEDCKYCAQSKESKGNVDIYPMKKDEEILEEARHAFEAGAYRHCMVFSGRELEAGRIEKICSVVKKIKNRYPMQICISAGFLSEKDAEKLSEAGVDRYNHNLNTSRNHYGQICTSHEYSKRIETIGVARKKGLDICSGIIIGMGETIKDLINMISELKKVKADSIPINFFIPVEGHRISDHQKLSPHYCLKVLSVFRFAIPEAEIRAAGGREYHLRSLQSLCLYAVDSLFARGYLTTGGNDMDFTRKMIEDSGFIVEK